ncbi:hypothetical protein [Geminisphaera colitermitum]|uniref:hypothetical protein n=1 Tax=Geminisphaera colitermitum TaxID=1148786 RepID=UPI000158C60A|nr:hypothetical protein [Geminisphaera colitermitum]
MIHRILFLITATLAPFVLLAQTLPPPSFLTVATNPDGTLRAPANFWEANSAAIAGALDGTFATAAQGAKADNAVQRVTTPQTVYGVSAAGAQTSIPYNVSASASSLVMRDASGKFHVQTPTALENPTNKGYVDARTPQPVAAKITIQMPDGYTDAELKLATDNYASGTLTVYIHTPDLSGSSVSGQVIPANTRIYYTATGAIAGGDTRKIRSLPLTDSGGIGNKISANGRVGSIVIYVPVSATITPSNAALAWTYNLMDYTQHEQDADGHSLWRTPSVEWVTTFPSY